MGLNRDCDIDAAQRKTVLALLERHLPNTAAWAYGSRAQWTARPQSDLDMVVFASPEQNGQVSHLREAFEESNLPFRVDLFVWDAVPEKFRKQIEAEHVVLVEKKEQVVSGDWPMVTLGEFAPFSYGKGLRKDIRNPAGHIPVFGSNGHVGWHDKALTDGPTVVIGRKGTVGAVHYSPAPCWPIDTTFFISGGDAELVRFKYYALGALGLGAMNTDSAVPGLNRDASHIRELRVPPLPEQRAIARILGALDDKIELNRRMNETLEAMARALFRSWFVDFDPVRAKMAGRDPNLPKPLADLFPDRLVNSELGAIPEGWEESTIGEEVAVVGGSTPSTKNRSLWDGGINWATPKDLSTLSSPVLLETARQISETGLGKIGSGLLPQGTVLLSSRAPIGYLAIAETPVAINQGFIAMRCEYRLSNMFVWLWVWENIDTILQNANGSTFQEISKRNFRPLGVVVPALNILSAFDKRVRPLYERIAKNQRESHSLAILRDGLLPKLLSAELRMKGAVKSSGRFK